MYFQKKIHLSALEPALPGGGDQFRCPRPQGRNPPFSGFLSARLKSCPPNEILFPSRGLDAWDRKAEVAPPSDWEGGSWGSLRSKLKTYNLLLTTLRCCEGIFPPRISRRGWC